VKYGSVLQCDFRECTVSFHVRCAIKEEIIKDWDSMNENRVKEDDDDCMIFCAKHEKVGPFELRRAGLAGIKLT